MLFMWLYYVYSRALLKRNPQNETLL